MSSKSSSFFGGMLWSAIEKFSVQGVSFIIGIILARILSPQEYGIIGLLTVFITLSQVFIDSGFSSALIQNQTRNSRDISTVFLFNFILATLCYFLIWVGAPAIAQYYDLPKLKPLIRVLAVSLFFNAFKTIPQTLLTIDLNFKALAKVNITSTIISGIIAIILALKGFGEWALVWLTLIKAFTAGFIIWFFIKYRPELIFSKKSFKKLFNFGSKLLISSILNHLVNNFSSLFIGKVLSVKALGFYNRGTQNADMLFSSIYAIYESVLLPSLSKLQDTKELLIEQTSKIIKTSAILVFPVFLYLAAISKPLTVLLLGEKWILAAPIMSLICIARSITIISGININLLYAIGRSDLVLKQQYVKLIIRVLFLLISFNYGIIWIAVAELTATIIHFFINTYYPGKFMQYGAFSQIKNMTFPLLSSIVLAFSVYFFRSVINSDFLFLIVSSILFFSTYYFLIKYVFNMKELKILFEKVNKFR